MSDSSTVRAGLGRCLGRMGVPQQALLVAMVLLAFVVALTWLAPAAAVAAPNQKSKGAEASPSDKPPAAKPSPAPAGEPPAAPAMQAGPCCRYWVYQCCGRRRARCCVVYCGAPCRAADPLPAAPAANAAAVTLQPVAAPAKPESAPPAKPDPHAWRDLFDGKTLKNWKSAKFGGEGKVEVTDGMIVMAMGSDMTGIVWDGGDIPRDNYELTLEGMRLEGGDFFCSTTFPVGKEPCTLVVGGWGGTVVGLSNVDGYDASDNPTTTFQTFKDKQWYKFRLRVSAARIEAWMGNERVVNQERKDHKFGIRFECDPCQPLGVATWCTKGAVRNIRVRQLKAEEIKAAAEEKKEK